MNLVRRIVLAFVVLGMLVVAAAPSVAATHDPLSCVPQPGSVGPKQLLNFVLFLLFFWDPALWDCLLH